MKIYLVRHGESEANKNKLHNTPATKLTKRGVHQAKMLAKRLRDIHIDFIYASTHTRSLQTAEEISKELDIPIEKWSEIVEVITPSVNWGKPVDEKKVFDIDKNIDKNYIRGKRHSDEELFVEIKTRVNKVLKHLVMHHKSQNILLVSHNSFIKMLLLCAILGEELTPQTYVRFRHHARIDNSGISVLEYHQKKFVLVTWNDKKHI